MLVVDASSLYYALVRRQRGDAIRRLLASDPDIAAPHLIDVEVLGVIRREFLFGHLDATAAGIAIDTLRAWPAERHEHRNLLSRAWELRYNVRGWDAMYVALAERLDATLITTDARLARAVGPRCPIELV